MLNHLAGYFYSLINNFSRPQTYGTALEEYIVRHAPQNACDVDRLTRQFEIQQSSRGW
jgi:2-polyprenyl-3-methyl-5-hydroxy-6-metoxy-1,4-benzoquinol methylase